MKLFFRTVCLTFVSLLVLPSEFRGFAQVCITPPSGLVSWWAADGTANDEQGANQGVLQNGVAFAGGGVNLGFSLDGVDDYVSVPASPSLDVGAGSGFTIEGWISPANISSPQVIAEWNNATGGIGVHFMHSIEALGGVGSLFANVVDSSGGSHYFATSPNVLAAGTMQHVALTYDKNTGDSRIFLNGVATAGVNLGSITPQTTYPLYLGIRASGGGSSCFFHGTMDEISLYNRALADGEVLAIYNATVAGKCKNKPPAIQVQPVGQTVAVGASPWLSVTATGSNPRYQWLFNDNVITNATNATLQLNHIQIQQAGNYSVIVSNEFGSIPSTYAVLVVINLCVSPGDGLVSWWPADGSSADQFSGNNVTLFGGLGFTNGKVAQAFSFDGVDDYAAVPAGTADVGSSDGFTVECWIKPADVTTAHALFEWNSGGADGVQLWTSIPALGGVGSLFSNIKQTNGVSHILASAGNILNISNFQHVALTYNRTSGVAKLYHNGSVVASQTIGAFRPQTTYPLNFGKRISGGTPSYYQGALDEVGLYARALTDAEVISIYLAAANGKTCQPPEFLVQPAGKAVTPGSNVAFTVVIRVSLPITAQWKRNGTILAGETNLLLIVSNAQPSLAGNYTLHLTNAVGFSASSNAYLKVNVMSATGNGQPLANVTHSFNSAVTIQLLNAYPGGLTFYTLDGSPPTFASSQYAGPFVLSNSVVLRALGYRADFFESGELDAVTILLPPSYPLILSSSGGGSVSASPVGSPYLSNTVVTLTAKPSAGWTFLKWLDDANGTNTNTTVIVTAPKSVRAIFGTTLNTTAAGGGSVALNPPSGVYPYGTTVQLSAIPNSGNQFALWGNAGSGNVNPLSFAVTNPNPTVSSLFVTVPGGQSALTILPLGRGQVVASPSANTYTTGSSVTITATPDFGQTFLGWSGDAIGLQNPLATTITSNRTIVANFTTRPQLTISPLLNSLWTKGPQLTILGNSGDAYRLESSTNINQWTTVTNLTNSYGSVQFTDATATNMQQIFYRAKRLE